MGLSSDRQILEAVHGIKKATISKLKKDILAPLYLVKDIYNEKKDLLLEAYSNLDENILTTLEENNIKHIEYIDLTDNRDYLLRTLREDQTTDKQEALDLIYSITRNTDAVSNKTVVKEYFNRLFLDIQTFNLSPVGRFKINERLGLDVPADVHTLTIDDIIASTRLLIKGVIADDIDHLSNRKVKTVGELIKNQFRIAFSRVKKLTREKINSIDTTNKNFTLDKLINLKAFQAVIKDFFGRGQLSQFMDQTNPLAEMSSKRRISALGPGGLNRERAGFEVRDIHPSHYGRICPIETPEGANIGLISSLALFARVNDYGFLESPYRKVKNGKVLDEIEFLDPISEKNCVIAQANAPLDENNKFTRQVALSRHNGDSADIEVEKVTHMDVSPKQLVSPATCCIPFLEHNDANRALMGANMQRQAVPLLQLESPLIGTGIEAFIARDSNSLIIASEDGEIVESNALKIVLEGKSGKKHEYSLFKYLSSNSGTCINQKTIVFRGQKVKKGQVLADGFATDQGELALGKNLLVAFMSWNGYNFEDAIIVSERLVQEDVFTSIHITEAKIAVRQTKFGTEEITRDIPNVPEHSLRNLDSEGIIRIGTEVNSNDILVGKITPKNEVDLTPEEKLFKALFGEKASDVKDSSLRMPAGAQGVVTDIRIGRQVNPKNIKMTKNEKKSGS